MHQGLASAQALYETTLDLLEEALRLWPGVNVRMHYVDKLLAANRANSLNPPPALLTGLHIMTRIQDTQVGSAPVLGLGVQHAMVSPAVVC